MKKLHWIILTLVLLFIPKMLLAENNLNLVALGAGYQQEWGVDEARLYFKKPSATVIVYHRPYEHIGYTGFELVVPLGTELNFYQRWLFGLTIETNEPQGPEWLRTEKGLDGKAWLTFCYEKNDFSLDAKIPLAHSENGERWYPQLTLEGIRYPLSRHLLIDAKLQYDGQFGFRENTGLLYKNKRLEIKIGTNGFGAKYLYQFESIGY